MAAPHTPPIPESIRLFIERSSATRPAELARVFAVDAVVTDDGETMSGRPQIEDWIRRTDSAFTFTTTVTGAEDGLVRVHLAGDFPGGVVDLTYRYRLDREGLIASLDIR